MRAPRSTRSVLDIRPSAMEEWGITFPRPSPLVRAEDWRPDTQLGTGYLHTRCAPCSRVRLGSASGRYAATRTRVRLGCPRPSGSGYGTAYSRRRYDGRCQVGWDDPGHRTPPTGTGSVRETASGRTGDPTSGPNDGRPVSVTRRPSKHSLSLPRWGRGREPATDAGDRRRLHARWPVGALLRDGNGPCTMWGKRTWKGRFRTERCSNRGRSPRKGKMATRTTGGGASVHSMWAWISWPHPDPGSMSPPMAAPTISQPNPRSPLHKAPHGVFFLSIPPSEDRFNRPPNRP